MRKMLLLFQVIVALTWLSGCTGAKKKWPIYREPGGRTI